MDVEAVLDQVAKRPAVDVTVSLRGIGDQLHGEMCIRDRVRGGLVRQDPVLAFWTLPWQLLRAVCQAISSAGARLPLTSLAWRLRVVVIGVAVVQCLTQHQLWLAVTIGCIGAVSYAMPVWERRWQTRCV